MRVAPLSLAISLALSLGISPTLMAQAAEAEAKSPSAEEIDTMDEIVAVGTRVKDRTVAESVAPVDVLSPEELENAGTPDLQSVLARMVPSFNFPRTAITDASDHVRPAQLRGLAPDQTLVLVNGKRRHRTAIINVNGTVGRGSSPTDLSAIPTAAIQRVEVLRDGAAAQYGSDAIAGVINIVLKDANDGASADVRYGIHDKGDGELFQASGNVGMPLGAAGFLNFSAEFRDKAFTNRSEADDRQQYPLVNGRPDPREASFDRINHRFGDAQSVDIGLFVNGGLPLGDSGAELYGFVNYADRDGASAGFFRRALDARNIISIYPNGFLPLINSDSSDTAFTGGLRGTVGESGLQYDVSISYGASEFDFTIANSLNVQLGPTSQTSFDAGTLGSDQTTFNADFSNNYDVGWLTGGLNFAFGLEYRAEGFEISPGEPASYFGTGSQVFPGFRPSDAIDTDRKNFAMYADIEGNLTDALSLGAAVRAEDYSDFGQTTSGKLSGRFAITDAIALRATASTGFRAPNLQQQFYSTTSTNFINGQPFDIRTFPVTSPVAQALGAQKLEAEEAKNLSFGVVITPIENLSITLDAYRIKIEDRIVLSENLTGTGVTAFLAARGFAGVTGGRYFTNAVDTSTEGADLIGRYQYAAPGDYGQLTTTVGYNYNKTDIDAIQANPPQLAAAGLALQRIGRVEIGRITEAPPRSKLILGQDWYVGDYSVRLNATRYGNYNLRSANPLQDESFKAEWVLDLSTSVQWNNFNFTLGAENLNNNFPQRLRKILLTDSNGFVSSSPLDNSFTGILPYARGEAPFGFNGRFYYAKVNFSY
jgi:iron complex outermembrane recepter protein